MGKLNNPPSTSEKSSHTGYVDVNSTKNTILDTLCLVIAGEIISLIAGNNFSWKVTIITLAEVVILAILAFLAKRHPYNTILSALFIFIIMSIITAAVKPTFLGGSIIVKIFILMYLVRAIPDARELEAIKKEK